MRVCGDDTVCGCVRTLEPLFMVMHATVSLSTYCTHCESVILFCVRLLSQILLSLEVDIVSCNFIIMKSDITYF